MIDLPWPGGVKGVLELIQWINSALNGRSPGGQSTKLLEPLTDAIGRYVRQGKAIFSDDTPIKMQAKKKCTTARIWTYVRDVRPCNGQAPPFCGAYAAPLGPRSP